MKQLAQVLSLPSRPTKMSHQSLKDRLAAFLKKHYSAAWISSGNIQRIVAERTDYTPQNVGRRLRELENEGIVEVKYVRGHAHYRFKGGESIAAKIQRGLADFERLPG